MKPARTSREPFPVRETLLEFRRQTPPAGTPAPPPGATRCSRCGHFFSADGRFCPFDGEKLVAAADWDPLGDPLLGQTIDQRYAIEAVIGEGGMGRVYRANHIALGKHFALKVLRADLAGDPEIADRFIHEARTAASVEHPGLVTISDFGHLPSGQAYFVMELLEGMPLSAVLRRGGLRAARAVALARKIAEALEVVHRAGVVHRDLKPDNIQVVPGASGEHVKIVDFGLAKVLGSSRLTRQGIVFGTPYYMSPEQAAGEPIDHRADIYALGIVLYEMLTGAVPFEADTYMGVLSKHIYQKPTPPSELLGGRAALGALEDIVLKCLEKDPGERYASLARFRDDLDAVALPATPPAPLQTPPPILPLHSRTPWIYGALLLGGSAVAGSLLVSSLSEPASRGALRVRPGARAAAVPAPSARPSPTRVPELSGALSAPAAPSAPPPASGVARRATGAAAPRPSASFAPASITRRASAAGEIVDPWGK